MSRLWLLTIPLLLVSQSVSAMTATGRGALALASLVADQSPTIRARERNVLRQMFNGRAAVDFPIGRKIEVRPTRWSVGWATSTSHNTTAPLPSATGRCARRGGGRMNFTRR